MHLGVIFILCYLYMMTCSSTNYNSKLVILVELSGICILVINSLFFRRKFYETLPSIIVLSIAMRSHPMLSVPTLAFQSLSTKG